jgi:hypothetical protein
MKYAGSEKLDKLSQIFDMAEETIHEIVIEEDKISLPTIYVEAEDRDELITIKQLKCDLKLIRETLIGTVHQGRLIIDTITKDIVQNGMVDAKLVDACANLIKSTNSSLKELSSIFKELNEIEERKKKNGQPTQPQEQTNVQNNIFVGNANELMNLLNGR